MSLTLDIGPFLEKARQYPVIDVRSPGEFAHGHIPGAHNIPLFSNEERARVGTLYKQKGRQEAIAEGLEIVGPKLRSLVDQARGLAVDNQALVHCWRGGMRSANFAWLLNTCGIKTSTLVKGYKAYRNHVLDAFRRPAQLLVLGGETGSGKTEILRHLAAMGEQVVDLERLARHKGSSFDAVGEKEQPGTEQFENDLFTEWDQLDLTRRVWVEDESKSIGRVYLPDGLWDKMKLAPIVRIRLPKKKRIERLVQEYGKFEKKDLEAALVRIERRLGGQAFKESLEALQRNDLAAVAGLTLHYYDKAYNHAHEKRKFEKVYFVDSDTAHAGANAERIRAFVNSKLETVEAV